MTIDTIRQAVIPACKKFAVRHLDVFGSVVRNQETAISDIDLLVEFNEPERTPAQRFFGLLHYLEDTLGCKIDLLTTNGLHNPYFKSRVLKEKVTIYEG